MSERIPNPDGRWEGLSRDQLIQELLRLDQERGDMRRALRAAEEKLRAGGIIPIKGETWQTVLGTLEKWRDRGDELCDRAARAESHLVMAWIDMRTARVALTSIAKNTCCDGCQEAALVARDALSKIGVRFNVPEENYVK